MNKNSRANSKTPLEYYEIAILELNKAKEELQEEVTSIREFKANYRDLSTKFQEFQEKTEDKIKANERNTNYLHQEIEEVKGVLEELKSKLGEQDITRLKQSIQAIESESNNTQRNLQNIKEKLSEVKKSTKQAYNIANKTQSKVLLTSRTTGIQYDDLSKLLERQQWREADIKTRAVMLKILGMQSSDPFCRDTIHNFYHLPCEDIRIINSLWFQHSNGHFGWTVQKRIYYDVGKNWDRWGDSIGWRRNGSWIGRRDYETLKFSLDSSVGHLPVIMGKAEYLFKRLNSCEM